MMKKLSKILFGIAILGIMSFAVPVAQTSAHAEAPTPTVDLPFEH
ncbi:Phr family secreted Rap phosphatase inhibitor [Mesobacillus subterraneus]|nr:Phr family secreted Rap phosphatase inhibitor [Mesobacillus subterraneus]MCM3574163.1 Phr family secreted Rap phosphatase inhibitor [Mesobacillus subterraneus]